MVLKEGLIDNELVLNAFKIQNGLPSCKIGYVYQKDMGKSNYKLYKNSLVQVVENDVPRKKSKELKGVTKTIILGKTTSVELNQ